MSLHFCFKNINFIGKEGGLGKLTCVLVLCMCVVVIVYDSNSGWRFFHLRCLLHICLYFSVIFLVCSFPFFE